MQSIVIEHIHYSKLKKIKKQYDITYTISRFGIHIFGDNVDDVINIFKLKSI